MGEPWPKPLPPLGVFGRRPRPNLEELVRYGVRMYPQLGPWFTDGGRGFRWPIPLDELARRAEQLRSVGVEPQILAWPPWLRSAIDAWAVAVGEAVRVTGSPLAIVDHEPIGKRPRPDQRIPQGWRIVLERARAELVYGVLRDELPPETSIGCSFVHGPEAEGVRAALEVADVQLGQCYQGDPEDDAQRIARAHRVRPSARVCPIGPAYGPQSGHRTPFYLDGILATEAPVAALYAWSDAPGEEGLEEVEWEAYAARTRGRG